MQEGDGVERTGTTGAEGDRGAMGGWRKRGEREEGRRGGGGGEVAVAVGEGQRSPNLVRRGVRL